MSSKHLSTCLLSTKIPFPLYFIAARFRNAFQNLPQSMFVPSANTAPLKLKEWTLCQKLKDAEANVILMLFAVSWFLWSSDLKLHKWVWFDVTGCFHPNGNRIKTPCRGSDCQICLPGHFCGKTHNMSAVKIIFTQPTHQTHHSYWRSSFENTDYIMWQHFAARLESSFTFTSIYLNLKKIYVYLNSRL